MYWRAVSHDRLNEKLTSVLSRVSQALLQSREIESNRLETPLTALTYQRELMDVKQTLQEIQRELSLTKLQLAALMNLSPGTFYELEIPARDELAVPDLNMNIETMEDLFSHPIYGASYEGYAIENIVSGLPRWQASFYRTANNAEIDLILEKGQGWQLYTTEKR